MRARGLLAVHVADLVHAELVEGLEVEVEGFVAEVEEGVDDGGGDVERLGARADGEEVRRESGERGEGLRRRASVTAEGS